MATTLDTQQATVALARLRDTYEARTTATDPVAWVQRTLGETFWSKQREIAQHVAAYTPKIAVPSAHGTGKSHLASRLIAWWVAAHPPNDTLVITTAPTHAQVATIMWRYVAEIHAAGGLPGSIVMSPMPSWKIDGGLVAFGRKTGGKRAGEDTAAMSSFQGYHEQNLLIVLDEACGVPTWLWEAVGTLTTGQGSNAVVLAIGNPDDPGSRFAEVCEPDSGWQVVRIPAHATPNFTGEQVPPKVAAKLVGPKWVDDSIRLWGADSNLVRAKVHAQFPTAAKDQVIDPGDLETARNLTKADVDHYGENPTGGVLGVDVSRSESGDEATIVQRFRNVIKVRWRGHCPDTTELANRVVNILTEGGPDWYAIIDADGVGGPVADMIRERGGTVVEFRGNARPYRPDRFLNARAEAWWTMRDDLAKQKIAVAPDNDGKTVKRMVGDLSSVRWHANNPKGLIQLEAKELTIGRLKRSPDLGDAAVMSGYVPPVRMDPDASGTARRQPRAVAAGIMNPGATPW